MVRMSILRMTTVTFPLSYSAPAVAAILGTMQIDSAANHMLVIGGVDHDRIAVRHLPFFVEMAVTDVLPGIAAIRTAIDTQHQVAALAAFVRRDRVEYLRF